MTLLGEETMVLVELRMVISSLSLEGKRKLDVTHMYKHVCHPLMTYGQFCTVAQIQSKDYINSILQGSSN